MDSTMDNERGTTFAEFFYEKRMEQGLTLRKFCVNKGLDPAYISRLENGLALPPENYEKLKALATAIELVEDTTEWVTFFDLAAVAKGRVPEDIYNEPAMLKLLPAFYRTVRSKKLDKKEIEKLIDLMRGKQE